MMPPASRGMGRRLIGQFFQLGEVTETAPIAARMLRITITAPGQEWVPGQQVRVCVGNVGSPSSWLDGLRRTYSVWSYDGELMTLCVLDHGDGPGARWARAVRPGQEVLFGKPEGPLVVRPAPYHVFVGEETASVAFGPMMAALLEADRGADIRGVIEVGYPADRLPLPDRLLPDRLTWRYRHGAPAASSQPLLTAVTELDLPGEPGSAYVAGEARTVQMVTQHLVRDRGWPRRAIRTKPFWAPGRTGLD
jgi:NADPH-dependent ferric siderophore reductase